MTDKDLLLDINDNVAVLTINRPKFMNAVNFEMIDEFGKVFNKIKKQKDVRVLIITGTGHQAFMAGADVNEMNQLSPMEMREKSGQAHQFFEEIEKMPQFVIAAVNGAAIGAGCELSSACDMTIAAKNASFDQPEASFGLIPGFGGAQRISRLIGPRKAKELLATGKVIDAQEAYRIGLVDELVDDAVEAAKETAKQIVKNAPLAVKMAKYTVDKGYSMPLDMAVDQDVQVVTELYATQDRKEAMNAFAEKRKPKFIGK